MTDQNPFTVSYETRDKTEIARFSGAIKGGPETTLFHGHISKCLEQGIKQFCLNLADVTFINSVGLGMLISALTTIKNKGGRMCLCCLPDQVVSVLTITKLLNVFSHTDTEEWAIRELTKR